MARKRGGDSHFVHKLVIFRESHHEPVRHCRNCLCFVHLQFFYQSPDGRMVVTNNACTAGDGTRVMPVRGAMRHTWHMSADCLPLTSVVDDPVLTSCFISCCCCWSSSSASLASSTMFSAVVCAPTLC